MRSSAHGHAPREPAATAALDETDGDGDDADDEADEADLSVYERQRLANMRSNRAQLGNRRGWTARALSTFHESVRKPTGENVFSL